jgi:hypothetical protein
MRMEDATILQVDELMLPATPHTRDQCARD